MSRSNPTTNNPSPVYRWFEWKGSAGKLVWYDKEKKESVDVPKGFRCIVLDQLSTITGYNKKAKSGITSNEVRDVRAETLVVKYFSGRIIAEGFWSAIKKDVSYEKGKFACSCYIAFRNDDALQLGNIRISGCALGPWFDFVKEHRADIDKKGVSIMAGQKDTTGDVEFVPPMFSIVEITPETDAAAKAIDAELLQPHLKSYFKRTRAEQAAPASHQEHPRTPEPELEPDISMDETDEIPFDCEEHVLVKNLQKAA